MIFRFGSITVQFQGDNRLVDSFQKSWNGFIAYSENLGIDAALNFSKSFFPRNEIYNDGWEMRVFNGEQMALYSQMRKPLFAIQCQTNQKRAEVVISCELGNTTRLGAQFGLLTILHKRCVGLHGVTLLCGDEIIILSAPSGTGKTTLAGLLEKYCDAIVINGDFALLNPTEDDVIYEPTLFCGTSGRSLNHRFRVSRVVFLGQAKENHWRELDGREAMIRFMSNAFVPEWDSEMTQAVQENILKCISAVKVNAYDFAPTQEAAEMFLEQVEGRK